MAKSKANPLLSVLQDQINERIRFGILLIELKALGAKLGFNVQLATGSKKAKPAKKAVKKAAKKVAPKRKISAAGRKRIAKAQRARWAKVHAAKKAKQAEKEAKKKAAK